MPKKKATPLPERAPMRPALSPEARDQQMIALTYELVEQRLRDGTATSQETTHFLKMGTAKYRREQELLELQKELVKAKTSQIKSTEVTEKLVADAIKAFGVYSGQDNGQD